MRKLLDLLREATQKGQEFIFPKGPFTQAICDAIVVVISIFWGRLFEGSIVMGFVFSSGVRMTIFSLKRTLIYNNQNIKPAIISVYIA